MPFHSLNLIIFVLTMRFQGLPFLIRLKVVACLLIPRLSLLFLLFFPTVFRIAFMHLIMVFRRLFLPDCQAL